MPATHRTPVLRLRAGGHGIGEVGGVPEHYRGDDEVEAGGAKLLCLGTPVSNPALLEGADDLREGVTLLALVEPGMAAPAQIRAFEPVEHKQRALDLPQLLQRQILVSQPPGIRGMAN